METRTEVHFLTGEGEHRCDAPFFAEHSIESLARRSDAWLSAQGRLTQPMYRPPDGTHYQPISWDEAFAVLARHLRETTPERTAFYTSNRTSNEASFLYHLFVREYGTNRWYRNDASFEVRFEV